MTKLTRVWAEIELSNIRRNLDIVRSRLGDTKLIGIIKADGYGHGALPVAIELEKLPYVWGYGVATAEEALMLRDNVIRKPIIIIGYSFPESLEELIIRDIRITVFTREMVDALDREAKRLGIPAKVHVKVDTGMGRIGIGTGADGLEFIRYLLGKKNIIPEGIFTHFARADEEDKYPAKLQYSKFTGVLESIRNSLGFSFPMVHCANSAALLDMPEIVGEFGRCGIIMYGHEPSRDVKVPEGIEPLLSLKSRIAYIKQVPAGTSISYGGTYVTDRPMTIATIPVGYGDGYPRALSNKGQILVKGKRCNILGRICMDQFMCDISEVESVDIGDEVTLIGRDGNAWISLDELSEWSGMLNYEMICVIGKRVPRIYLENGKKRYIRDFFLDAPLQLIGREEN